MFLFFFSANITISKNNERKQPDYVVDIYQGYERHLTSCVGEINPSDASATSVVNDFYRLAILAKIMRNVGSATIEDIVEAIAGLDPTKDYGKNGKPNVDAIQAALGADISAAQRDQAWEIFQKEKDEDGKEE